MEAVDDHKTGFRLILPTIDAAESIFGVDVELVEAREDWEGLIEDGRFVEQVHPFVEILLSGDPKDGALVGGSAGEGLSSGDGHGDAGGETSLAGLGITGEDGEAAGTDEVFDDECTLFVFGCEGAEEVS